MTCGIYKITNRINGKSYIGQSINIQRRLGQHKRNFNNLNSIDYDKVLYKAIRRYGIDNFDFEIVKESLVENLNKDEMEFVKEFNTLVPNGYNVSTDAQHGVISEETYQIINLLKNSTLTGIEIGLIFGISDQSVSDINNGRTSRVESIDYPIRKYERKECISCKTLITNQNISGYCKSCLDLQKRTVDRPSAEQLKIDLIETNFTQVGKKYGVSDNAIRKWCKAYGMSTKAKDYKTPK